MTLREGRAGGLHTPAVDTGHILLQALLLLLPFRKAALMDIILADAACHHPRLQATAQLHALKTFWMQLWALRDAGLDKICYSV